MQTRTKSRTIVITVSENPGLHQPVAPPRKKVSLSEWGMVALLLGLAFLLRFYAALHTGVEVDEPIYRDAAATALAHIQALPGSLRDTPIQRSSTAMALLFGYPSIRPAYLHPTIPFLYHPPFYLWFLAGWFWLWNSTSYLTGRMFSVFTSLVLLVSLYLFVKNITNKKTAFLTLLLVGCDPWIIFTNQAIYLENSLILFALFAIWAYWHATQMPAKETRLTLRWYALTGLLAGWVIIYKQIGGFIVLVFLLNLLIQRKHWQGHMVLGAVMGAVVLCYVFSMHGLFGQAYDAATLDQFHRTIGAKAAPGLNDSVTLALRTAWNQYWMFLVTIVALLGGSVLAVTRYAREVRHRGSLPYHSVIISWALGGIIFALAISLKSPHYLILWLIPLYIFLAHEIILLWKIYPSRQWQLQIGRVALSLLLLLSVGIGDLWGFQERFTHVPGDTLLQADAYINVTLPPNAIIATQNYIGVDITPPFLDITLVNTPQLILRDQVTYMALYWSSTQPVAPGLGPVNQYCLPMKTFTGFKDSVEVCKIDLIMLSVVVSSETHTVPKRP